MVFYAHASKIEIDLKGISGITTQGILTEGKAQYS